jgi:hypothetical protein
MIILITDSRGDASSNKLLFQLPEDVIGSGLNKKVPGSHSFCPVCAIYKKVTNLSMRDNV